MGKGRPKKKRNYRHLTEFQHGQIFTLAQTYKKENKEVNYREIGRNVGCDHHTVKDILEKIERGKDKDVSFIFQHDNDPKHTSKVAQKYLRNANIVFLDWPSQSPDLNPIEHLWNIVKNKLDNLPQRPSSLDNLFEVAKREWGNLSVESLQTLIDSMPDRIQAVIKAKGHCISRYFSLLKSLFLLFFEYCFVES